MVFKCLLRLSILLGVLTATLVSAAAQDILPDRWVSTHGADNPLVSQSFSGNGEARSFADLIDQSASSRFVLLGEIHDNPDHHVIQANILNALIRAGQKPAIVWEMVPQRLSAQVNQYDLAKDPLLNNYADRLQWEKRGWYSWEIYRPIALAAARAGLTMMAGNLDRQTTRAISKTGLQALSPTQVSNFALTSRLADSAKQQLFEELQQSHCNLLPQRALPAMANVQRARDGALADAMVRADDNSGAVLIAGNGHIRKDRAVPFVLRQRQIEEADTIAIALVEVSPDLNNFSDYELTVTNEKGDTVPLYDFVIFTPQFDNSDHCVALRKHFKNSKKTDQ